MGGVLSSQVQMLLVRDGGACRRTAVSLIRLRSADQLLASVVGNECSVADSSRGLAETAAHLVPLGQDHLGSGAINGSRQHRVGAPAFDGEVAVPSAAGAVYVSIHFSGPVSAGPGNDGRQVLLDFRQAVLEAFGDEALQTQPVASACENERDEWTPAGLDAVDGVVQAGECQVEQGVGAGVDVGGVR